MEDCVYEVSGKNLEGFFKFKKDLIFYYQGKTIRIKQDRFVGNFSDIFPRIYIPEEIYYLVLRKYPNEIFFHVDFDFILLVDKTKMVIEYENFYYNINLELFKILQAGKLHNLCNIDNFLST